MEEPPSTTAAAAALEAVARRADGIRLPPVDLPGWSSLCATEYRLCVVALLLEVSGLRLALAVARVGPS